jgi:putative transposase
MTEDEKKQVAAFRFGVICDLVNGVQLASGEQEQLIREKCARKWQIPFSNKTRVSRSTILRWMRIYKNSNGRWNHCIRQPARIGEKAGHWIRTPPWP